MAEAAVYGAQRMFASFSAGVPEGLAQLQWPDALCPKPPFMRALSLFAGFFLNFA